jgi:7,8-dihydropterin-6-yl-methyl-4-(beta-D-ribofuranosyl)aminobenzene 5'-phosphate synthase
MKHHWKLATLALACVVSVQAQAPQPAQEKKVALDVLPRVTVTVLVDNMAGGSGSAVLGEWGLAFLINTDRHQILLDSGGGRVLLGNARALNVDLAKTEAIVLSHEHADHTAGLDGALSAVGRVDLFVHPAGFDTRYSKGSAGATAHRLPFSREQLSQRVRNLVETRTPTRVSEGLMVTGQVPRTNDFEDTGVRTAFLDETLKTPDQILDDQAVFFRVPEGIVILLGCAHAGLVNTMEYVSQLTGEQRIFAVMGGTHLVSASPARMQKTIEALRKYGVQRILLSHCTGVQAFAELAGAFPGLCSWPASGTRVQFGK